MDEEARAQKESQAERDRLAARVRQLEQRQSRLLLLLDDLDQVPLRLAVPDGRFLHVGGAAPRVLGLTAEQLTERRRRVHDLLPPADREWFDEIWAAVLAGEVPGTVEFRFLGPGGDERWILLSLRGVRDDDGTVYEVEGICRDTTAVHRATDAIFAEKEQLLTTLESIADGVIATDAQGVITLMNPEAERLTGWTWEEALGRPLVDVYQVVEEPGGPPRPSLSEAVLIDGEILPPSEPVLLMLPDGGERLVTEVASPIRGAGEQVTGMVVVFRDETVKRRMAEEAQRTQKLEAVGVLAGGIAHDFNNILTAVLGNVSLVRLRLCEDETTVPLLGEAERALERARGLTHQLLTFARGGSPVLRPTSVGDLVRESLAFSLAGSNVACHLEIPDDLWPAELDEAQVGRVLQNLALNAEEAMSDGGTLRVGVLNKVLGPGNTHGVLPGRYLRISVEDHGVGIDPELLERIFEPYFTTKPAGSGLGLSVCHSIVEQHHGAMVVESTPGLGTVFFVYLPASEGSLVEADPLGPDVLQGTGRVLVVDDESMLRDVACAMLEHLGFEAEAVADGAAAVDLFGRAITAGRPFDAVVMDLTIPGGMGGREAVQWLRSIDPDVRCIVSSGYSDDPVMADHRRWGFRGMVRKPYRVEDLARALHAAIGEAPLDEE